MSKTSKSSQGGGAKPTSEKKNPGASKVDSASKDSKEAKGVSAEEWAKLVNAQFAKNGDKTVKTAQDFVFSGRVPTHAVAEKYMVPHPKENGMDDFWQWCPLSEGYHDGVCCHIPLQNVAKGSPNFGKKAALCWWDFDDEGDLTIEE